MTIRPASANLTGFIIIIQSWVAREPAHCLLREVLAQQRHPQYSLDLFPAVDPQYFTVVNAPTLQQLDAPPCSWEVVPVKLVPDSMLVPEALAVHVVILDGQSCCERLLSLLHLQLDAKPPPVYYSSTLSPEHWVSTSAFLQDVLAHQTIRAGWKCFTQPHDELSVLIFSPDGALYEILRIHYFHVLN